MYKIHAVIPHPYFGSQALPYQDCNWAREVFAAPAKRCRAKCRRGQAADVPVLFMK